MERTEQSTTDRDNNARKWTFRGYQLDPANFTTAMVHFYRGEMGRASTWRTRLDATTNWAVITVAAALTFVFGEPLNPHFVFLLVLILVFTFLLIEARRYRYYALWAYRVHMMETDFFAAIFTPPFQPSSDWGNRIASSLNQPTFPISRWEAIGRRFRRNYFWLISLLLISWGIKLMLHPTLAGSLWTVIDRAAIGPVEGIWVTVSVTTLYILLTVLAAAASISWSEELPATLRRITGPLTSEPQPKEQLATVVTGQGQAVASLILDELGRGVTALKGTGMYTGEKRDVLLCAVTDVQIKHLKEIVHQVDPDAFVIVSSTTEVHGGGFRPFKPPS